MADEINTTTTDNTTQQPALGTGAQATKPEPKFTQEDMDAVAGNRAKEAAAKERARILKELGIENIDDPEAIKTVKGKLTAAQKAEEERLSDIEKATKRAEEAEKKAAEAEAKAVAIETKRRADYVDGRIETLARDAKAIDATEVAEHFRSKRAEEIDALYSEDGKFNEEKAKKLIEDIKKAKAHWFKSASGVSSPSVSGGRPLQPDAQLKEDARSNLIKQIKGSF